jgi:hypothetical protein
MVWASGRAVEDIGRSTALPLKKIHCWFVVLNFVAI